LFSAVVGRLQTIQSIKLLTRKKNFTYSVQAANNRLLLSYCRCGRHDNRIHQIHGSCRHDAYPGI